MATELVFVGQWLQWPLIAHYKFLYDDDDQDCLHGSLLMIHTALHACCVIAVPNATMHVQTTFFSLIFPFLCRALD